MAMHSMTGYGRGAAAAGGIRVDAELSSVNRKQFDVRVALPRALAALESRVIEIIQETLSRGHVSGNLQVAASEAGRPKGAHVDARTAAAFVRELRRTARALELPDDLAASSLLRLPEVVSFRHVEEDPETIWPLCERALRKALRALVRMRAVEGKALERDLRGRLGRLRQELRSVRSLAPAVTRHYRDVLVGRLHKVGVPVDASDPAVLKELAMFAERCDISEEITRLDSHLAQAADLFRSAEPVGRTLDFLAQEMLREINTIGSKANDVGIVRIVIQFKTELERFREQVQNVE